LGKVHVRIENLSDKFVMINSFDQADLDFKLDMRHFARDLYLEANPTAVAVPKFTLVEIGLAGNALTKERKRRWHVEIDELKGVTSPQDDDQFKLH
jgi:hypothetical protein